MKLKQTAAIGTYNFVRKVYGKSGGVTESVVNVT